MSAARPNILFIMDDQHRFDYMGCAGADFLRTPTMDSLAAAGTRFTHCYTNAPICAPARIALATGLQAHRFGGVGNSVFLPQSRPTYYQRLRDAGYRVGCVGKLDLAKPDHYNGDGARPRCFSWGFTHPVECEGKMHAGMTTDAPFGPYTQYLQEKGTRQAFMDDYEKRKQNNWSLSAWDSVLPTEDFEDAYIGRRAAQWIQEIPDDCDPWHLFVSFVGPHDPFDPPTEYADRYRDAEMPPAIQSDSSQKPTWVQNRMHRNVTPEQIEVCRRQYCASTELVDDAMAEILQALDDRGMRENTYIIFSSDHGEMLGDHGLFTKAVPYDPSIRVPLIIAGPGIEAGRVSEAMVELIDLNPTICELAGLPPQPSIDARSIGSVLAGEAEHREEIFSALASFVTIRTREWKLVHSPRDTMELYDMQNDPEERHNVCKDHPDIARALLKRHGERLLEGHGDR